MSYKIINIIYYMSGYIKCAISDKHEKSRYMSQPPKDYILYTEAGFGLKISGSRVGREC